MVDIPGLEDKTAAQETIFNSDIGDDWGEAFEAEDFMVSSRKEADNEFFLPDETVARPPVSSGKGALAASPTLTPAQTSPASSSLSEGIALFLQSLVARFRKTSTLLRLAVVALPILALIIVLVLHQSPRTVAPKSRPLPTQAEGAHSREKLITKPPQPETTAHKAAPAPEPKVSMPEVKKIRKSWRFPAIIVPVKADNDQSPAILTASLTLILKLTPESTPPAGKDSFIREALYQFFINQPLDDLQGYALVRGEMSRKLQAWILKQWPELPLDSITVDRYQLL